MVANHVLATRPHLTTRALPFVMPEGAMEMLSQHATHDDEALAFVREHVARIADSAARARPRTLRNPRASARS
jgi:LysR family transcriptional activator of mexEF-oprN operon